MPFYIVNITASVSILSFSLNNEMLRETHYLYDTFMIIKQNIIHTAKGTTEMVSSHSFPKQWTDLECHQQCINDHENIHIFIMYDPAALLLELYPKEITQNTRMNFNLTQYFIRKCFSFIPCS